MRRRTADHEAGLEDDSHPSEVVGGVAYLLGGAASLVTGHTLAIDGGYTIQ